MATNTIRIVTYVCAGSALVLNLGILGVILVQNKIQEKKKATETVRKKMIQNCCVRGE
ncbi:MAG: hypothetical protein J6T55_02465 [Alphaproteobacteria bacterium]|nr:hypothetical protein [Alphaproteobacteria bacterium]